MCSEIKELMINNICEAMRLDDPADPETKRCREKLGRLTRQELVDKAREVEEAVLKPGGCGSDW